MAEEGMTTPISKSNRNARRGGDQQRQDQESSFVNSTPLAHADTSRDLLPRGGHHIVFRQLGDFSNNPLDLACTATNSA
ncbi:hypothetical protein TNCV_1362911 [Trichonephila clavipes]|nr:hypothetical protein TNCV_1362911 [Trichonephila clavipes]